MRLINAFKTESITVTRYKKGAYHKGRFRQGASVQLKIPAVVIPIKGQELLKLPEGQRTKEGIKVYTKDPLKTADDTEKTSADILCLRGKDYEVQDVQQWHSVDLPHYRSLAVKIEPHTG